MEKTIYYTQRQEGYEAVLNELKKDHTYSEFEAFMKERIYRWWANWKPDYEGWLECADGLYAREAIIDAIGKEPQKYLDYRTSMKDQRDMFEMDMGPIETCVTEKDTIAFNYRMYMTPKFDMGNMKKGETIVLKVSEFNTFEKLEGYNEPMVTHLQLIATGM